MAVVEPTLSRSDIENWSRLSKSFTDFLDFIGFKGAPRAITTVSHTRGNDVIDFKHRDVVRMWVAWNLCFRIPTNVLWLTDQWRRDPVITPVLNTISQLGNIAYGHERSSANQLLIDNGNRLDVHPVHPNAGRGASPTCIVIEGLTHKSPLWNEIVENLQPVVFSVTKGQGRIITINSPQASLL